MTIKKTKRLKTLQNYPWPSTLFALILITYLVVLALKNDVSELALSLNLLLEKSSLLELLNSQYLFLLSTQFLLAMVAVFILLLAFDLQRFKRKRKIVKINSDKLRAEIEDLWESKKHLNNKAHTYSGHADKLKLFISDKLLEYIEYDEKFLHFKSIAAEVRHNGVISYDIVSSLLQTLIDQQQSICYHKGLDSADKMFDSQQLLAAQQGLESMRYLWDLLDLSTADNIALHIANQLINAEEHHYQRMLEQDSVENNTIASKELKHELQDIRSDFSCFQSIHATLQHLVHEPATIDSVDSIKDTAAENQGNTNLWQFQDEQFHIQVQSQQALLGNSNHVRLILENVLKNAQHFSRKVAFKQKTDRILLSLTEGDNGEFVDFQVYNRGPKILDDNKQKLFQLGYSTRKSKEHHGKGLGLFFVNEIVKGYEGLLTLENIENQQDSYSIRIALADGQIETHIVNVDVIKQRAVIINGETQETNQRWQYAQGIASVEISASSMQETARFSSEDSLENSHVYKKSEHYLPPQSLVDNTLMPPRWSLDIQAKRGGNKTHNVIFNVLDIAGVRFSIKLPTAQARVDGVEPSWNDVITD